LFLFGQDLVQSLKNIIKKNNKKNYEKETPGVVNTCAYMGIQECLPKLQKELIN